MSSPLEEQKSTPEEQKSTPEEQKAAPKKRSLFDKPAWPKSDVKVNTTGLFHRAHQTYAEIAAEEERKRKERATRKERERVKDAANIERHSKRRRVSQGSDDEEEDESPRLDKGTYDTSKTVKSNPQKSSSQASIKSPNSLETPASPKSLSERYEQKFAAIQANRPTPKPSVINLEDNSDEAPPKDDDLEIVAVKKSKPLEDEFSGSDEEFPELARKARETARRKRLQADSAPIQTPDLTPIPLLDADTRRSESVQLPTPPPPPPDPVVSLLLTSEIPNTKPLMVTRKINQRLKDVRLAWCDRQGFTREFSSTVILTWRGKRLFDVTTCKSLGIGIDVDGNIITKGEKDVFGERDRHIHMEALTEESFENNKKIKEQALTNQSAKVDVREEPIIKKAEEEPTLRIILKAKGLNDFKLIVKFSTKISRITNAFRLDNKISPEKEVYLLFDGDRLEPHTTIGETELSDMDHLDAYIK